MSEAPVQSDLLELDLRRYELRRGGIVLKLEKIPMELLILLVERRDQLVGREEIIARLWGKDVFLDTEQGINTAIRKIRLALDYDPNQPRFLQSCRERLPFRRANHHRWGRSGYAVVRCFN